MGETTHDQHTGTTTATTTSTKIAITTSSKRISGSERGGEILELQGGHIVRSTGRKTVTVKFAPQKVPVTSALERRQLPNSKISASFVVVAATVVVFVVVCLGFFDMNFVSVVVEMIFWTFFMKIVVVVEEIVVVDDEDSCIFWVFFHFIFNLFHSINDYVENLNLFNLKIKRVASYSLKGLRVRLLS
jgi:hypothetical protein